MPLHAPYDPDNIFAKMLRGDIPSVKVFEDEVALAFMDIFPQATGHTLKASRRAIYLICLPINLAHI